MQHRVRYIAGILTCLIALTTPGASAQTPETMSLPETDSLEGIEAAVVRTWASDIELELEVTPDAVPAEVPAILGGAVFQFDSAENAAAAWTRFADATGDYMLALVSWDDPVLTTEDIPNPGDQARSVSLDAAIGDSRETWRYVIVRDDTMLFVTSAVGSHPASMVAANALALWIVEEGTAGDDEVIFDATGASSGGLWGYFPPNDHALLDGLAPINDEAPYPEATPRSDDAVG